MLDEIRNLVRKFMGKIARALNSVSGGRITPNMITIVGTLAFIPFAWLLYQDEPKLAAIWLIIFGLFDTLDGELARLQNRASPAGMFLDSVTDRIKEILIYIGIGAYIAVADLGGGKCGGGYPGCVFQGDWPRPVLSQSLAFLIAVLGVSMLVSYLNAWGEAVMARSGVSSDRMNKVFRGGLASFEIRMTLIALGLFTGLFPALLIILILALLTVLTRMTKILRELRRVQN